MPKILQFLVRSRTRSSTTRANLIVRYVSLAVTTATGFLMVPLYLAHIPADLYGFWLAAGYFMVLITTCDPGLAVVLQQKVAAAFGRPDLGMVGAHIGSGLLLSAVVCALILLVGLCLAPQVPIWVGVATPEAAGILSRSFSLAITGTSLALFSFSLSAINQGLQSCWAAGGIVLVVNLLSSALTALLLVKGFGVEAIALGTLGAGVAYVVLQGTYLLLRLRLAGCRIELSGAHTRGLCAVFSYTIIGRAASIAANNVDLLVVCKMLDSRAVVLLSVSRKAIEISRELINQLVVSFMPALSHLQSAADVSRTGAVVTRLTRILIWLSGFVVGGVICFNDDFVRLWVGSGQFVGPSLNLMLAAALLVGIVVNFLHNIGTSLGNFKGNSVAAASQSVIYVGLVIGGSKHFDLAGTILAPAFAPLLGPLFYYIVSFNKAIGITTVSRRELMVEACLAVVVTLGAALLFYRLEVRGWVPFLALIVGYMGCYTVLTCIFSSKIRTELRSLVLHWVRPC